MHIFFSLFPAQNIGCANYTSARITRGFTVDKMQTGIRGVIDKNNRDV